MSDELATPQDQAPAAPVDQAPAAPAPAAAPALDPAIAAAIAQAVVAGLQQSAPPPAAPAPAAAEPPKYAPTDFKRGALAVYEHDHFGTKKYQIMLVVDVYQVTVTDPKTKVASLQDRLRMLPVGTVHAYADLPADQLIPADDFDWEDAA